MRNVIVTGASRGLGLGIAQALAGSGFRVIAIARKSTDHVQSLSRRIATETVGDLHFRPFDLADIADVPQLVKGLQNEFGPVYGLVNNAALGEGGILASTPDSRIERLLRLNVTSPIILTKYVLRSMMTGNGGRIVSISSVVGFTGYTGLSVYSATKASLLGLTRSLAREVGPLGITVNAVAPGFIDTEMTHDMKPDQKAQIARRSALRRLASADDVGGAVDFLFSEKAGNITGTVITVDAGNTA